MSRSQSVSSPAGVRKVLRAESCPESSSGFIISAVDVRDACCGPNDPMELDSDHLYTSLAQQLSKAASADLSKLFASKPTGSRAPAVEMSVATPRRRRHQQAYLKESLPCFYEKHPLIVTSSTIALLGGLTPPHYTAFPHHHHPTSHVGNELNALGSESLRQRQRLNQFIEETLQLAGSAKQALDVECQRRLDEQSQYWQRHCKVLDDEIQKLQVVIRDQQQQLTKRHLLSTFSNETSESTHSGRSCGGPSPPTSSRLVRHWTKGHAHRVSSPPSTEHISTRASDELLPQRVTEALLHILQKQPVPMRKVGGSSPKRTH